MRIVVWNLAKSAQKKLPALRELMPDIAVVPECAPNLTLEPDETFAWCGASADSAVGLGVIGFNGYTVDRVGPVTPEHVWTMPVRVGGVRSFNLLAVWADMEVKKMKTEEGTQDPMGPLRLGLRANKRFLANGPAVVAGDFNNAVLWDKPLQSWNHSYGVADLASLGLSSAYHRAKGCEQGEEPDKTFYLGKRESKGYHIDFCFVPDQWRVDEVTVGPYEKYCTKGGLSDHAPMTVIVDGRGDGDE